MKTAVVTGGNQGLGSGFVECLLGRGWRVYATTRVQTEDLMSHENLTWVELELASDESITNAFETISREIESIDLLINNAGVNKDTATKNHKEKVSTLGFLERQMLLNMFNINAVAPLLMTQKFLPLLQGKPSFVVNISSCRASYHDEFENEFGNYGYRGSKIALNMFTFCSVMDLPENIKTFAVHPGSVRSHMNPTGANEPIERAEKIINITENWREEFNGKFMRYDGNLYPL